MANKSTNAVPLPMHGTSDQAHAMHPLIKQHQAGIDAICRSYHIRKLDVFGSAARAFDFDPQSSDADFLVEFASDAEPDLQSFYGAKSALEQLLGRTVDLVEYDAVRNPYVLASMNQHRQSIYVA